MYKISAKNFFNLVSFMDLSLNIIIFLNGYDFVFEVFHQKSEQCGEFSGDVYLDAFWIRFRDNKVLSKNVRKCVSYSSESSLLLVSVKPRVDSTF